MATRKVPAPMRLKSDKKMSRLQLVIGNWMLAELKRTRVTNYDPIVVYHEAGLLAKNIEKFFKVSDKE